MIIKKTIVLMFIVNLGFGQNFPVSISEPEMNTHGKVHPLPDGNILIDRFAINYDTYEMHSILYRLNVDANIQFFKKHNYIVKDVFVKAIDSIYLLSLDIDAGNKLFVDLVDENLELQRRDSLQLEFGDVFRSRIIQHNDSIMFYLTNRDDNFKNYLTIGMINSNGTFSSNIETIDFSVRYVNDVLINQQNEWIILSMHGFVLKLDAAYNVIYQKSFMFDYDIAYDYNSFWYSDKYFITGGTTNESRLKIVKWKDDFTPTDWAYFDESDAGDRAGQFSNVAKADSCIYFVGTKGMDSTGIDYSPQTKTKVMVACLDFELNVLWEKEFGGDGVYIVYSVCTTNKSECVVLASRDTFPEDFENELYILKLNSKGDIVTSTSINEFAYNVSVYPNPGKHNINIELPYYNEPLDFNIYNLNGQCVLSTVLTSKVNQFEIENLPTGLYIYQIRNDLSILECGKWISQ